MTNEFNNNYTNMTSKDKDNLCDHNHEIIQELIQLRNENNSISSKDVQKISSKIHSEETNQQFKRQLTSTSCYGEGDSQDDDNNPFIFITKGNKRKQRTYEKSTMDITDNDEHNVIEQSRLTMTSSNNSRLFINSRNKTYNTNNTRTKNISKDMSHHYDSSERRSYKNNIPNNDDSVMNHSRMSTLRQNLNENNENNNVKENQNNEIIKNNNIYVSQHALHFAVEQHLPPLYIKCTPKLVDHQKGKEIIKALFVHIETDFKKLNKHFTLPLGFEYWFIDKNGDLVCFAKNIELFVYLCEVNNYPKTLAQTDILPSRPKHLPSQHSLILKYVPNYITIDDIQNEISSHINTLFNIEEMNGSNTGKSRHIRIEIKSAIEYDKLLHQGGLTIDGHIIEVNEFLAPPRLLFCSKCNDPGHVRKHCNLKYEACRRCGEDKSNGNHNECNICCHRCKQNHIATDYKCKFLMDYRRALLQRLKQKPYLLPPNVKLFIPTECREDGDKNNMIVSSRSSMSNNTVFNATLNNQTQHLPFNINSHGWPSLDKHRSNYINSTADDALWKEIKNKENEIEKLREEFNNKIQQCQNKYDNNIKKIKSILLIISAQTKYQNENVERCNTIINDFIPLLSSTLTLFQQLTANLNDQNKMNGNTNETRQLVQYISNSIECMKERNDTLITSQKSLHNLVDQQGQLLSQAVNSLELNND
ncbi:unnamed protein product [Rotaria socialis]|uniref:CCHC-type domain-containing protein n=1 Tax=Rotaria socialis TaxID=392032 RepID=A0A821EEP4_9BILA|nr:unnamed protein product [Rotaria socialis]CAF4634582.1 unnamed protein product [Rotaria socialis]